MGNQTVNFVKVTATFYDSDDTVIATATTFTTISVLLPRRKSPFLVWDLRFFNLLFDVSYIIAKFDFFFHYSSLLF